MCVHACMQNYAWLSTTILDHCISHFNMSYYHLEDLTQIATPYCKISDSVGLGWVCVSHKFPGGAGSARLKTTL